MKKSKETSLLSKILVKSEIDLISSLESTNLFLIIHIFFFYIIYF